MKRMLINATQKEELRVALVDGQRLYDLDIEHVSAQQKKSNIYKGKITRVEPSLEAAFVDYGAERHGFLPIKEISQDYFSGASAVTDGGRPDYKKLIREGQEVMVQVDKEERGNKGAALTTYVGLAGRYLVCMPNNPKGGGVSRRVQGNERRELRDTLDQINVPEGVGVIVRTAGVGRNHEELQWDLNYQMQVWEAISDAYEQSPVGALLYQESNIIVRALRDYFREDISEIIIDDEAVYKRAHGFMSLVMPDKIKCLKNYFDELPLFTRYQIEAQIDSAYGRNVRLPSGGELVIDYTEAMVSIDINSARSTKGGDVEETAFHTNVEAAEEIARQLRLRDIGGLIVVDFIDMYDAKHRRIVEDTMRDAIRIDRARVQLAKISKFGLLEMSRQRLRPSIDEASHSVCPRCKGQGSIRSTQSVALSILRLIEEDANKDSTAKIVVQVPIKVSTYLLNEKRDAIASIEKRNDVNVILVANESLQTPNFELQRIRHDDDSVDGVVSYKIAKDFSNEDEVDETTAAVDTRTVQKAVVATIEPPAPPPKPKIGFFKKIKRALGFTGEAKPVEEADKPLKRKTSEKGPEKSGNRSQQRNPKSGQNRKRRKPQSEERTADTKKQQVAEQQEHKNTQPEASEVGQPKGEVKNKKSGERQQGRKNERKKPAQKRREPSEAKPFVNPHATEASKVHSGRPVRDDAVRGSGKAGYVANVEQQADVSESTLPTASALVEIDVPVNAPAVEQKASEKPKANRRNREGKKPRGERVFVPRSADDALPALTMSDVTEIAVDEVPDAVATVANADASTKDSDAVVPSNMNPIAALGDAGQSVWYDNINRDLLESGTLDALIAEDKVKGVTSNPAIFEAALASNHPGYVSYLEAIQDTVSSPQEAFTAVAVRDIAEACEKMRATFDASNGVDGMVSLEVSPDLAYDAEATIAEALSLHQRVDAPNVMIKVPATEQSLDVIEQLTYFDINTNVTLLFSVERYNEVRQAYIRGLQRRKDMDLPINSVRSVASFFISRIDTVADTILADTNPDVVGKVAIANAKVAYASLLDSLASEEWQTLATDGAQPQRLLWASTGTKNPQYSDVLYVEQLIGAHTVNTIPPATYTAFKDHGVVAQTLSAGLDEAHALIALLPNYGVHLEDIAAQLEKEGVTAFENAFKQLLEQVEEKMPKKLL